MTDNQLATLLFAAPFLALTVAYGLGLAILFRPVLVRVKKVRK